MRHIAQEERNTGMEREGEALLSKLEEYGKSDFYPLHMPGHKRNLKMPSEGYDGQALFEAASLDITEIDGFDNLHEPEGILKDAMERAARLYGADHTFYSVNGSTAGLLTAISAAVPEGKKLIMARNCHRAVYHAVYLRKLHPVYLYPGTIPGLNIADVITPGQVERALLDDPDAAAVLLTSPTYDGITADVEAIAGIAHRYGVPLIVDAAHGAHFGFHPGFPDSPVHLGADLTVVSLHKTMPCMTQTALLHVRGDRVDLERLRLFEGIYQTSSPSYILMAAMDHCVRLTEEKKASLWDSFFEEREHFFTKVENLSCLRVVSAGRMGIDCRNGQAGSSPARLMDSGKILIDCSNAGLTGKELYDILLERYHLQPEMAAGDYVTAIMTCCDTPEGWERLAQALHRIDSACRRSGMGGVRTAMGKDAFGGVRAAAGRDAFDGGRAAAGKDAFGGTEAARAALQESARIYPRLETVCSITDALDAPKESLSLEEAAGRISGAFINLYPPGIPLAVPGERLSEEVTALIKSYERQNLPLYGVGKGGVTILKN